MHTMLIFFLILAIGFVAAKAGIIKRNFLPELAKLITKVLLPCLIFYATVTGCTRQAMADNLPMMALAAGFYAAITLITFLLIKLMRLSYDMVIAITLIAALPTMTIVPMIAAQRGPYGDYAAGITVATLVLSLITIPLVAFLVL